MARTTNNNAAENVDPFEALAHRYTQEELDAGEVTKNRVPGQLIVRKPSRDDWFTIYTGDPAFTSTVVPIYERTKTGMGSDIYLQMLFHLKLKNS